MGSKIANDTPPLIVKALSNVDVAKINPAQLKTWIKIAKENIDKFVPRRKKPIAGFVELPMTLPKELETMINEYDFDGMGFVTRAVAIPATTAWINNNLPMRRK